MQARIVSASKEHIVNYLTAMMPNLGKFVTTYNNLCKAITHNKYNHNLQKSKIYVFPHGILLFVILGGNKAYTIGEQVPDYETLKW